MISNQIRRRIPEAEIHCRDGNDLQSQAPAPSQKLCTEQNIPSLPAREHNPDIDLLSSSIPTPFPSQAERERLLQEHVLEELANEAVFYVEEPAQAGPSKVPLPANEPVLNEALHDVMPSIAYVQYSCLRTLNNLFSMPKGWNPIVPDRRRSLPGSSGGPTPDSDLEDQKSALQTLVLNLRNLDSENGVPESNADVDLIRELEVRVQSSSSLLPPADAHLARALVSLLSYFNRLSTLNSTFPTPSRSVTPRVRSLGPTEPTGTNDVFDTLKRQLSDLRLERLSRPSVPQPGSPPTYVVESALLWSRIDVELENVVVMCKERTEDLPPFPANDHLPPQYDPADFDYDPLPEYEPSADTKETTEPKVSAAHVQLASAAGQNEKMRLDLEAVTMAIDRLYRVAPQLHDQRVELKMSKVKEMEKASREGKLNGKQKQKDIAELENLFDMLGKASDRKLSDQTVTLDPDMKTRLEKSRLRDKEKRDAFVEQLVQHSETGRLHGQDAILQPPKPKDPNALLTLPEFIRESVPATYLADPRAMLTLPEFVKEPVPSEFAKPPTVHGTKSKSKLRNRSLSAPPLSWLRPSSAKASGMDVKSPKIRRPSSSREVEFPINGFTVHYVAENHESLQHVIVFLSASGITPGVDLEAEVFSPSCDGEYMVIKSGTQTSAPLALPGRTNPGKKVVKVQGEHYEIKLSTFSASESSFRSSPIESVPLLDAAQLSKANPTSFICASCSLPLVQSSAATQYRDLPSEHWQELVDAWMCHADQKLHDHVAKCSQGFWPEAGQALVGGSYILFEQSAVLRNNLFLSDQSKAETEWRLVRCLCGAVTGRWREKATSPTAVYRFLKYAVRPVAPSSELLKVPLSAFVVGDMMEFVQAHATYRFVIHDEEEEKPRLLIWLFKPSIRLSYMTPMPYVLPHVGCVHAAKVLYKIVGPYLALNDLKSELDKYPGFPQAEYLFYPIDICRRLASSLKESNSAYPKNVRTMTGLDVGWLLRA